MHLLSACLSLLSFFLVLASVAVSAAALPGSPFLRIDVEIASLSFESIL